MASSVGQQALERPLRRRCRLGQTVEARTEHRLEGRSIPTALRRDDAASRDGDVERSVRGGERGDDERRGHGPSVPARGPVRHLADILPGSMTTPTEIQLPIEGMTCASCVNRIERFLRQTDGVESATVNLATEIATIRYLPEVADRTALVGAVEAAGYDVRPAAVGRGGVRARRPGRDLHGRGRRARPPRPRAAARGARLDRRGRRDHDRDVRPADDHPDGGHQPAGPHPGHVHPGLGRAPLLPPGLAGRPPRHGEHGHARRRGDDRPRGPTASS